jgi:RNA polymerase sigma-70 factor (ECF subfamily)
MPRTAEEFIRLLQPHQRALEDYCRRQLWDRGSIEDVLQEAVLKAYRDFGEYRPGTNFRAWIFRYATLEIRSVNRARARQRSIPLGPEHEPVGSDSDRARAAGSLEEQFDDLARDPESALMLIDDALQRALGRLPALERATLLLRAVGDFRYREIAEILEIPVTSVMGYLSRARRRLAEELAEHAVMQGWIDREGLP